jgi:RES domain-containing protein
MNLWRIAAETRQWSANEIGGMGSLVEPGRWNDDQHPVVYAATTISLAVLETAAHLPRNVLPLNRFLVRLDVPEDVWAARETHPPDALPPAWQSIPPGRASVKAGTTWLAAQRAPVLLVPSVIVPEEPVVLVNPRHPGAREIGATVVRPFEFDRLFRLN